MVRDALPAGLTYVPNSINVVQGSNVGSKSDAADHDQAEYDANTRTIVVRLGQGADGTDGGSMPPNDTTTVTFRAQIRRHRGPPDFQPSHRDRERPQGEPGDQLSQRQRVRSTGNADHVSTSTPASPTPNACSPPSRSARPFPTPTCACSALVDADCGSLTSGKVCLVATSTCGDGCRGTGGNGCPTGQTCTSTTAAIGACLSPAADGGLLDGALLTDGANLSDASVSDGSITADGDISDVSTGTGGDGATGAGGGDGAAGGDGATGAGGAAGAGGASGAGGAAGADGSAGAGGLLDGAASDARDGALADGALDGSAISTAMPSTAERRLTAPRRATRRSA